MLILIPGPGPAEVIHNRRDRSIINSSAFTKKEEGREEQRGEKKSSIFNNKANGNALFHAGN